MKLGLACLLAVALAAAQDTCGADKSMSYIDGSALHGVPAVGAFHQFSVYMRDANGTTKPLHAQLTSAGRAVDCEPRVGIADSHSKVLHRHELVPVHAGLYQVCAAILALSSLPRCCTRKAWEALL